MLDCSPVLGLDMFIGLLSWKSFESDSMGCHDFDRRGRCQYE
jgi:hypothetical protein